MSALQEEIKEAVKNATYPLMKEINNLNKQLNILVCNNSKLYTLKEAAQMLKLTPQTIRGWVKSGQIECTRKGKSIYFTLEQLQK